MEGRPQVNVSMADLEAALRRCFGMSGDINAVLNTDVRPVLLADDVRRPGCNIFSGRHWSYVDNQAIQGVGGAPAAMKAQGPIIIDQVILSSFPAAGSGLIAVSWLLAIQSSTITDPMAFATVPTSVHTENVKSLTDKPPFIIGRGASLSTQSIVTITLLAGHSIVIPMKVHLNTGDKFGWYPLPDALLALPAEAAISMSGRNF